MASFCPIPTITPWWRGRPTMEGKTALGASSPANPALHMPEPLSTTRAATSSSHILFDRSCSLEHIHNHLAPAEQAVGHVLASTNGHATVNHCEASSLVEVN